MVEIFRNKWGLRIREVFFASTLVPTDVSRDLDIYIQHQCALPHAVPFWTACLDLTQEEADLHHKLSKGYRYEINRAAQKDGLTCRFIRSPSPQDINSFLCFYDEFALHRGLRPGNHEKLSAFASSGHLAIASVESNIPAETFAMHCYVLDEKRARLYYSATGRRGDDVKDYRQLIGRANKLLHWETIKELKRTSIASYDFGGISKSSALKGIDDFKMQFGAVEQQESNSVIATSSLGHIAIVARDLAERFRGGQAS